MFCLHFAVFSLTNILKILERCEAADIIYPHRVIGESLVYIREWLSLLAYN